MPPGVQLDDKLARTHHHLMSFYVCGGGVLGERLAARSGTALPPDPKPTYKRKDQLG